MTTSRYLGIGFLLGAVPLLLIGLRHLAGRDYVAGGLSIFAAVAIGHLGLELLALATAPEAAPSEEEHDWSE